MAEPTSIDNQLRDDEFLVLESLLSVEEFQKLDNRNGIIDIYCTFDQGVELVVVESVAKLEALKVWVEAASEPDEEKTKLLDEGFQSNHECVTHLPPISIRFSLPEGYPSQEPPHVTVSSCWLPRRVLHQLESTSKSLWKQNGQQAVLYELFQLVTDRATAGNFFPFSVFCLPIFSQEEICTTTTSAVLESSNLLVVPHAKKLFRSCVQFDENRTLVLFQQQAHRCGICFESYPGSEFIRLTNCRHFVCKECMKGLCANLIKDGSVHRLQCMECQTELNPFDIQLSVDDDVWEKYQQFQLDSALSAMQDIAYCPRPWCNQAVIKEGDSTCGRCPGCSYVFCVHCKRGYHGIEPCPYDGDKVMLVNEYEAADRKSKEDMEKKYGKNRLRNLCDEVKAEDWVSKNAKQCPKCNFPVEKMGGCNKMVCTKCGSAFCWLCLIKLSGVNPYMHFQDPANTRCYMNLMQGIEDSDDEDDDRAEREDDRDTDDENEDDWNDVDGWVDLGGAGNGAVLLADLRQLLGRAAVDVLFQQHNILQ